MNEQEQLFSEQISKPKTNYLHQRRRNLTGSFFYQQSPSTNGQFIFDDVYKNLEQKMKCQKNPKYAYFNSLRKMKSKMDPNTDLYTKIFKAPKTDEFDSVVPNSGSGFVSLNESSLQGRANRTAPAFHVEKLNNHAFKIFKQNFNNKTSHNMPPVHDISFQVHYQSKSVNSSGKYSDRPRLDDIMAQYRKINRMSRQRKQKQREARKLSIPQKTLRLFEKKGISGGLIQNNNILNVGLRNNNSFRQNV